MVSCRITRETMKIEPMVKANKLIIYKVISKISRKTSMKDNKRALKYTMIYKMLRGQSKIRLVRYTLRTENWNKSREPMTNLEEKSNSFNKTSIRHKISERDNNKPFTSQRMMLDIKKRKSMS